MPRYIIEYRPTAARDFGLERTAADWPAELDPVVRARSSLDWAEAGERPEKRRRGNARLVPAELTEEQVAELQKREGGDEIVRVHPDPPIKLLAGCGPLPEQGTEAQLLESLNLDGPKDLSGVLLVFVDTGLNLRWLRSKGRTFDQDVKASYGPGAGDDLDSHGSYVANCALALSSRATIADAHALPEGGGDEATLSGVWFFYKHLRAQLPRLLARYDGVVVNNSWGLAGADDGTIEPIVTDFYEALANLSRANVDLVFAAGNCGTCPADDCPDDGPRITGPNSFDCALCAGASATGGVVSPLSSFGPGSRSLEKPDVVTPSDFGGAARLSGFTSAAASVASGLMAEFRTRHAHRDVSASDARVRARRTAGQLDHDPSMGFGLLRRIE